jgi:hypothetical protein
MHRLALVPQLALAITLAATAQQTLVALGVLAMGTESGQEAPFSLLLAIAALALLPTGVFLIVAPAIRPVVRRLAGSRSCYLLAPALGLLVGVHFHAYDSYYLPHLVRFSELHGAQDTLYMGIVAAVSIATALAARYGRQFGLFVLGAALWVGVLTLIVESGGH